jgi:hypothetical protein
MAQRLTRAKGHHQQGQGNQAPGLRHPNLHRLPPPRAPSMRLTGPPSGQPRAINKNPVFTRRRHLLRSAAIHRFHVCFLGVTFSGGVRGPRQRLPRKLRSQAATRSSRHRGRVTERVEVRQRRQILPRHPRGTKCPVVVHDDLAVLVMLRQLGKVGRLSASRAPSCAPYRARTFSKCDDPGRRVAGTTPFRLTRPTPRYGT